MDVLLIQSSIYELPSSRRVGAMVYDGASDLKLWRGTGCDKDLSYAYGPGLQDALLAQRKKSGVELLPIGGIARIHPGKLHCDFLVWIGTRAPEGGTERSPAPDLSLIERSVISALAFVAERTVQRVAFPVLGEGPGAIGTAERIEAIVRAVHRYEDRCFAENRAPIVEEVILCEPSAAVLADAKKRVAKLARPVSMPPPKPDGSPGAVTKPPKKKSSKPKRPSRSPKPWLDPADIERARSTAPPYDRLKHFQQGDWVSHPKFGCGRVLQETPEGAIVVLFEDGEQRKMLHAHG